MASRAIKGVLSRSSWDFYEYSTGWAFIAGTFSSAGNLIYLTNPGTQQGNLDIYRAEITMSSALQIEWAACANTPANVGSTATASFINCCETNQPMPLGKCGGLAAPWSGAMIPIRQRLDAMSYDNIMLGMAGPFLTLAPGWAITVSMLGAGSANVSASFWFQTILDQVTQVR